jgi:16S rRNA (uracil1498-N3)-methyltransferase
MPASPAWPAQSTPRLFVDRDLSVAGELRLEGNAAHYLSNVLRLKLGDPVLLFDDISGEWLARVSILGKRDMIVMVEAQIRPRESVPHIWLCAALVKKDRMDMIAEKACELGVDQLLPVITRRTVVDRVNGDRLRRTMIEAAEQCHRTALPHISEPVKLAALLKTWPAERTLYFADETGGAPFSQALAAAKAGAPAAILIGPEGGFDAQERDMIRANTNAVAISLGPRILRAETAAIAALSIWMAHAGDWQG